MALDLGKIHVFTERRNTQTKGREQGKNGVYFGSEGFTHSRSSLCVWRSPPSACYIQNTIFNRYEQAPPSK